MCRWNPKEGAGYRHRVINSFFYVVQLRTVLVVTPSTSTPCPVSASATSRGRLREGAESYAKRLATCIRRSGTLARLLADDPEALAFFDGLISSDDENRPLLARTFWKSPEGFLRSARHADKKQRQQTGTGIAAACRHGLADRPEPPLRHLDPQLIALDVQPLAP